MRLLELNRRSTGGGGVWTDNTNQGMNRSSSFALEITKLEGWTEGESTTKFSKRLWEETKMALLKDKIKSRKKDPPQDDGGG